MGLVAIVILLLEATEEITLISFQGPWGLLSFNMWGPNYSKALRGPMGYKCTKFVPCGYCSFFARGDRRKHREEEEKKEEEETKQQEENIYALFHRHR